MRRFAALVILLALAIVAPGCGEGEEKDLTKDLTPAEILERAREASAGATTFTVAIEATSEGRVRTGATPSGLEALLVQPVDLFVKGRARRPHAMFLDMKITTPAVPLTTTLIQVGDGLYLDVLGQSFRLVTPKGAVASIEPANMPTAVLTWMRTPQDIGREEVGGTRTVHLRGSTGRESLSELGGLVAVLAGRRAPGPETGATIEKGEIDAWIGTGDLLPRRVRLSLRASGRLQALTSLAALSLDATLDFSAFGDPVDIAAPENPRALRLEDLTSLIGG